MSITFAILLVPSIYPTTINHLTCVHYSITVIALAAMNNMWKDDIRSGDNLEEIQWQGTIYRFLIKGRKYKKYQK